MLEIAKNAVDESSGCGVFISMSGWRKRNEMAIDLIAPSVGGAMQYRITDEMLTQNSELKNSKTQKLKRPGSS